MGATGLSSRIGTWWMNPRMTDVTFNVGPSDGASLSANGPLLQARNALGSIGSALVVGVFELEASYGIDFIFRNPLPV